MGYQLNGVDDGGIPIGIVKALLSARPIPSFIECGTGGGYSIRQAADLFDKCYTIDVDSVELNIPNVTFYHGQSVDYLQSIIKNLKGYALFWLDAHYSGSTPNNTGIPECPLIEEIKLISAYQESLIIIDDARLFLGPPPAPLDPREWPGICDVFECLRKYFQWHYITITDDYILCIPIHFKVPIEHEWRSRFSIRYPSAEDKLKTDTKNVYNALKKYIGE
jgi:hypothetical protein